MKAIFRFRNITNNIVKQKRNSLFGESASGIKGGLTTRFDPPPNGLRELNLHRSSTNVCTKTKMFLKIFFCHQV